MTFFTACSVSLVPYDPQSQVKAGGAPNSLLAVLGSSAGVQLSWSPVTHAFSYTVLRSTTQGSGYVAVSTCTKVLTTSCTDSTATPGVKYYYIVSAANGDGSGINSTQEVSATVPTYVVSPSGSDTNNGSQAAPFKTIQKAVDVATAGQIIGVRSGTYRETVTMNTNGVTLTGYQGDDAPILSGANTYTTWTHLSGSIYYAPASVEVTQLFVDDVFLPPARYPTSGYLNIDSDSADKHSLTSSDLGAISGNLLNDGGRAFVRTNNWTWEGKTITAFTSGSDLTFSGDLIYTPQANYGFYLENKLWMLTAPGGWVYVPSENRIYVWLPDSTHPTLHKVEGSIRSTLLIQANTVTVDGLTIVKSKSTIDGGGSAIKVSTTSDGVVVRNNMILDSGSMAIDLAQSNHSVISNNTINNTLNDAISANYTDNAQILNNNLSNIGTVGSPRFNSGAIEAFNSSNHLTIKGNRLTNLAYNGITFYYNALVQNNVVTNACQTLADCGSIYSFQPLASIDDTVHVAYNSTVDSNVVSGATGNYDGTPNAPGSYPAAGIYLDLQSDNITVSNNIVYNNERGIYADNSSHNSFLNNVIYGNTASQLHLDEFQVSGSVNSNVVTGNTMVAKNSNPLMKFTGSFTNMLFATFDYNVYSTLYTDQVMYTSFSPAGVPMPYYYSLDIVKAYLFQETHSTIVNPFTIDNYKVLGYVSGNLFTNTTFEVNTTGWGHYSNDGTETFSRSTSCANGTAGCAQMLTSSTSPGSMVSAAFAVTQNHYYELSIDNMGYSGTGASFTAYLEQNSSPYTYLSNTVNLVIPGAWRTQKTLFKGTVTNLTDASLFFDFPASKGIRLDNIILKEVNVSLNDPVHDTEFLVNNTNAAATIACPDVSGVRCSQYVDSSNTPVTFPVTLGAYGSKMLFWNGTTFIH